MHSMHCMHANKTYINSCDIHFLRMYIMRACMYVFMTSMYLCVCVLLPCV